jgi:hypothetical protein
MGEYALSFAASPRPLGDANGDGIVNRTDLDLWRSSFGFSSDVDLSGDGVVDGTDLLRWQTPTQLGLFAPVVASWQLPEWRRNFGSSGGGDTNGDAAVNGADFLMWQRQLSPSRRALNVPEPSCVFLLTIACLIASKSWGAGQGS